MVFGWCLHVLYESSDCQLAPIKGVIVIMHHILTTHTPMSQHTTGKLSTRCHGQCGVGHVYVMGNLCHFIPSLCMDDCLTLTDTHFMVALCSESTTAAVPQQYFNATVLLHNSTSYSSSAVLLEGPFGAGPSVFDVYHMSGGFNCI